MDPTKRQEIEAMIEADRYLAELGVIPECRYVPAIDALLAEIDRLAAELKDSDERLMELDAALGGRF